MSAAASTGTQSTEFKVTAATAGAGALGVLIEMIRGGNAISENVLMALLIAITLIGISYVLARGMAKYEYVDQGSTEATGTPKTNSEFKVTAGVSGGAILPLLADMLKPDGVHMSDKITITIVSCIAAMVIAYNFSRGLAKYENRGTPPTSPGVPGS